MIDGVSPISNLPPIDYTRQVIATRETFEIPASALRTEETAPRDPVADSVELSANFPQLINPTYAPPPVDQAFALHNGGNIDELEDDAAQEYTGPEELSLDAEDSEDGDVEETAQPGEETGADGQALDEAEQEQVRELKARDTEVRAHEQAHKAVGGQYAGAISYEYQQGPDGNKYAVGGEVSIDTSAEKDPEATIAKMRQVKAAAMAPAEPSGQDRSVAAQASQTEMQARQQLAEQQQTESAESASGAEETDKTEGAQGTGETQAPGADNAAERDTGISGEISGGGAASPSPSANVNRSAENAYAMHAYRASTTLAIPGYTPIDIVA